MPKPKNRVEYQSWLVWFPDPARTDYFRVVERDKENPLKVTIWDYTRFGAVGHFGDMSQTAKTKEVTTAKERREVDRVKAMIGRAVESSQHSYEIEKARESNA